MRTQFAGNHKPSFFSKAAAATRPIPRLWTSLFKISSIPVLT